MRSAVAVLLAIMFFALIATDPVVCADGCREDGGTIAPATSTYCVVCLGLGPGTTSCPAGPAESVQPAVEGVSQLSEQLVADLIEHPPQRRS